MNLNTKKHTTIILNVAIPSSSLVNDKTLKDKTLKIAKFARAFSIFGVSRVFIYKDISSKQNPTKKHRKFNNFPGKSDESLFLKFILEYLDTPQYLRKLLYPMSPELRYAGLLEPLNTPHHKKKTQMEKIKEGELRVGIVVKDDEYASKKSFKKFNNFNGNKYLIKNAKITNNFSVSPTKVDVGLDYTIPFKGTNKIGQKVTVKLLGKFPNILAVEASSNDLKKEYWGYQVSILPSLNDLLNRYLNKKFILLTSRKGIDLKQNEITFKNRLKNYNNDLLVVYGSPKKDIDEINNNIHRIVKNNYGMIFANMFPDQYTGTIRLEEAILGSLSIVNYILK